MRIICINDQEKADSGLFSNKTSKKIDGLTTGKTYDAEYVYEEDGFLIYDDDGDWNILSEDLFKPSTK